MTTVGLTGGIGSGKSEVARLLAEHGAVVVDADVLAREALAPGSEGAARVAAELGPDVLAADGSIDRARLADVVFSDPDKLAWLNSVVHPYVRRRSAEIEAAAPPDSVVVHDVPLLVENRLEGSYDVVVVVDASPQTQLARLSSSRGMAADDVRARMAAQVGRAERNAAADVVVDNDGDLGQLRDQVGRLWEQVRRRAGPPQS